ncbi:MAG: AraC family transcriptional regulator [Bacillota bacterium]|nr:AraC family transcriptional regulator [Bacillota bacterium]
MSELNVLWIGKYVQDWEMEGHSHTFFQIFGTISGKGTIMIEDETFPLDKETLFIVPSNCRHVIVKHDPSDAPKMQDIKFEILDTQLDEDMKRLGRCVRIQYYEWFSRQFDELLKESMLKGPHYYHWINSFFYCTLIHIIREKLYANLADHQILNQFDLSIPESYHSISIQEVLQYIREHYARPISLDHLARLAAINKTKLISAFKELLGITPLQYINQMRLQKAKELLVNTDISISEISRLAGFQSIQYFSRYFQSKLNVSPKEYRRLNTDNRFFNL